MQSFIAAVIVAVIIAVAGAVALDRVQEPSKAAYSTSAVRI